MNTFEQAKHFYSKFGFGLPFGEIDRVKSGFNSGDKLRKEFQLSAPLSFSASGQIPSGNFREMSPEERKKMMKDERRRIVELNNQWLNAMKGEHFIAEKMSLFWHDHFACKPRSSGMAASYINTLRVNSLGNFRVLVHQIAKEPAMLLYLNNQQNRKRQPNENFARELMELFTLGIGHYSESDIKEAARAFTGWGIDRNQEFILRQNQHDFGQKTFFGKSGNFGGEDIIDQILENRQTARYVSGKIARFLIGAVPDKDDGDEFERIFYQSDYEIKPLLLAIATSKSFGKAENIGNDILSPVELIVRLERDLQTQNGHSITRLLIQRTLGQMLTQPPSVDGWPSGKSWIDASTLPIRMRLSRMILFGEELQARGKSFAQGEDLAEGTEEMESMKYICNLSALESVLGNLNSEKQFEEISHWLLPYPARSQKSFIHDLNLDAQDGIKTILAVVTSLPEYQLK